MAQRRRRREKRKTPSPEVGGSGSGLSGWGNLGNNLYGTGPEERGEASSAESAGAGLVLTRDGDDSTRWYIEAVRRRSMKLGRWSGRADDASGWRAEGRSNRRRSRTSQSDLRISAVKRKRERKRKKTQLAGKGSPPFPFPFPI